MAALDAYYQGTSAISDPVEEPVRLTTPRTPTVKSKHGLGESRKLRAGLRLGTAHEVDPAERGDEDKRDRAEAVELNQDRPNEEHVVPSDGEAARVRSELARDLLGRVDALLPLVGDVTLATNLQLLRRDLSRCHDALKDRPSEGDFLSIITLAESAMATLKWKQYTRPQLEAIRQAFDIGYRQIHVSFEDYEKARTLFASKKVEVTPRIDLESVKWEDIADGDQK